MNNRVLTVADIYCGAGGLSAGFVNAVARSVEGVEVRYELVYGIDRDPAAMQTFRSYHFSGLAEEELEIVAPCTDIAEVTPESILDAVRFCGFDCLDVIIGGPNCQGVSAAGLRNPADERNKMLTTFIDLVRVLRPKWFVMENVPGLTHANNRRLLEAIFAEFEAIGGYEVYGDVLLAAGYGVPQLRYRLFIVGTNTGRQVRFPAPTHIAPQVEGTELVYGRRSYVTVRKAIEDLAALGSAPWQRDHDPGEIQPPNHHWAVVDEVNKLRIFTVPEGGDWRNMPIRHLPERYFATRASDQKGAYGRLMWDWPAYTITNLANNVTAGPFTHPGQDRVISVREAARLQSFEDKHVFYGSVVSQYRQVGNAVPPLLAGAVAAGILKSHFFPQEASADMIQGRLSHSVIKDSLDDKRSFPILTPRCVHPLYDNLGGRKVVPTVRESTGRPATSGTWDRDPRPSEDPHPRHTDLLRLLAEQPGNYRATKRARAIVDFVDGKPKADIVKAANVAESSVRKWVDGYYAEGLNGWRAYHTPIVGIANCNEELAQRLQQKVDAVRVFDLQPYRNGGNDGDEHKRYHMNAYLVKLKNCYGHLSVAALIALVEERLGYGIGTVYVDDLLAVADVIVGQVASRSIDNNEV